MTKPASDGSYLRWTCNLPRHWAVRRLKFLAAVSFSSVDKHSVPGEVTVRLCNYVDVYYHDRISADMDFMEATCSAEELRRFNLKEGDVLVTKDSESWDDIAIPAYVSADLDRVVCGYHLARVRPLPEVSGRYLSWCFGATGINDQFRVEALGITRYGLAQSSVADGLFPVPPFSEQVAIAAFLDRETAKIDELVAKEERLVDLLEEKRAAFIRQAVTCGLNPDVRVKESGADWIGRIPERWEIRRLKYLSRLTTSGSRGWATHYSDAGAIFLRVGNVARKSIDLQLEDIQYVAPPTGSEGGRTRVQGADLLISITAYIGAIGVVPENLGEAYVSQHLALTRLRHDHVLPRWVAYCLLTEGGQTQFKFMLQGGAKDGLGLDDVSNLIIWLPPLQEQVRIVGFIDREGAKVDTLITKIREAVDKLREYRTALISAAVTGKIDIRERAFGSNQTIR